MDSNLFKLSAIINVFPSDRLRIKNKKRSHENELIVAKVSNDIYRYYAWFLNKEYGVFLEPPPFGSHITINDGRKKIDLDKFSKYLSEIDTKKISIVCDPCVYTHWEFFAVRVYSPELDMIRKKLGLTGNYPFHITIGKLSVKSKQPYLLTREIVL